MHMQFRADDGRARSGRLSLRLRERLCPTARTLRCRSSSLGVGPPSELPVVGQRPPVVRSEHIRRSPAVTTTRPTRLPETWQTTRPVSSRRTPASRLHRRGVATPDCCSHAPPAARDVCAAPLARGHPREGGQALDRSAAADALPLEAALLHLDTDFELHRLSHRPGDAAVSRPTTRRVLVVQSAMTC